VSGGSTDCTAVPASKYHLGAALEANTTITQDADAAAARRATKPARQAMPILTAQLQAVSAQAVQLRLRTIATTSLIDVDVPRPFGFCGRGAPRPYRGEFLKRAVVPF